MCVCVRLRACLVGVVDSRRMLARFFFDSLGAFEVTVAENAIRKHDMFAVRLLMWIRAWHLPVHMAST